MSTRTKILFLSLLALLLLIGGVSLFLLQARGTLLAENSTRRTEIGLLETRVAADQAILATRTTENSTLSAAATAAADELGQALADANGKVESLTSSLAETENALADSNSALSAAQQVLADNRAAPPTVRLVELSAADIFLPEEAYRFIIFASDLFGLGPVTVQANGETIATFPGGGATSLVRETSFSTLEEGTYEITVTATDSDGFVGRAPPAVVEVLDYETRNATIRAEIEANVTAIRGLEPLTPIEPLFLTPREMRQRLEADLAEALEPDELARDVIVLSAFDFFDREFDLYNYYINLYAGSVLGFYDTETGEFVVEARPGVLDPNAQWTYAHEYAHALADQYFALERIADDSLDAEAAFALRALVEGEAELVQSLYLAEGYFTVEEEAQLSVGIRAIPTGADIIIRTLQFPYVAGAEFVTYFHQRGGWEAINGIYADLPVSSEQIMHPERYEAGDAPIPVPVAPLTDTLGAGWELLDEDVLGEFVLQSYLLQEMFIDDAAEAAAGWGGDRYAVYWNEAASELVMVLATTWDTPADADEFAAAVAVYGAGAFGPEFPTLDDATCWAATDEVYCRYRQGTDILLVRAPSPEMAAQVAAANE